MKRIDILIFGGQSNMQGQTEGLPFINEPVGGALEYRMIENELIPLKHPVGEDFGEDSLAAAFEGGGSLVPAFCRSYVENCGREVVAIHAARGNTTLGEWQKGTHRFFYMNQKIRAGIEKVKEKYEVGKVYYVWLQGESDAIIHTSEEDYLRALITYKNTLKTEFRIDKFGLIKVGYFFSISQWHTQVSTPEIKRACDETIMRAQEAAIKVDSDFIMLTRLCPDLSLCFEYINPQASGHYNNIAMDIIGEAAGKTLAELTSAH